jgi:ABC-type transport system involved in cytochrome c biogenesis ATPase subunit
MPMGAAAMPPVCLQVHGLSFSQPHCTLFDGWSATFPPGLSWVTGDEGVGKTTLMRLLAGQWPAAAGSVLWQDGMGARALTSSDVFWQDPASTALDEWAVKTYWAHCQSRYPRWSSDALAQWTERLLLSEHVDKSLFMLSTGSKRKVWLAAALSAQACVTLLDEPYAALDQPSRHILREELTQIVRRGPGVWLVADHACPVDGEPTQTLWLT